MTAVASLIALAIAIAAVTTGLQKVAFHEAMQRASADLGLAQRTVQVLGVVEVIGALLIGAGLKGAIGSTLGILNVIGAVLVIAVSAFELVVRRRHVPAWRAHAYTLGVIVAAIAEIVFRALQ